MKPRFQADASLKAAIVDGVRRREPSIDFRPASGVLPEGVDDLGVLELAASDGRILVSHDVHMNSLMKGGTARRSLRVESVPAVAGATEGERTSGQPWKSSPRNPLCMANFQLADHVSGIP